MRIVPAGLLALLSVLAVGSSREHEATSAPTPPGASCATPGVTPPAGCWRQILPRGSGGFPATPGAHNGPAWRPGKFPLALTPRLAFDGELWMTAQTLAYSSPDGLTWKQHEKTERGGRIYHSVVYFKGRLWMHGGMDYQARVFLNDVWASSDGVSWENLGSAAWPRRGGHTMVVHRDRLWLVGGANHAAPDRSTDGFLNDVWVSDDGLAWTEVTGSAPWSARDYAGVMVFNDELYMVGGQGRADVWRSSNGRDWTRLAAEADWRPRHDCARAVFDGRLWVLGGWAGRSTDALNDVWYSSDGVTWNRQAEHAPWAPRAPISIVFQDRIWIYSGKHTGGDDGWGGDLWQMTAATTEAQ